MAKSFDQLVKRTTTKKTRARAALRSQELLAELLLSESKLENRSDMQISTLRKIVKAPGGELEVLARFPKGTVKIDQFDPSHPRTGHPGPQELQLS